MQTSLPAKESGSASNGTSLEMRTRFWNNLINIHFQAFYYERYADIIGFLDKSSAIILALTSSTSVGAWLIWKQHPAIWASIIGLSQIVLVAKPFIPFIRKAPDYKKCALKLEKLYNIFERLWFECERSENINELDKQLVQLRAKKHEIDTEFSGLPLLTFDFLTKKARADIDAFMTINFPTK